MIWGLLLLWGCGSGAAPVLPAEPPGEAPAVASTRPGDVSAAVVASLCEQPCAGRIVLYRSGEGTLVRYGFEGDLGQCSHTMHTLHDTDGTRLWGASDKPTTPEILAEREALRAQVLAGSAEAEAFDCPR